MPVLTSREFFRSLPEAARPHLPPALRKFNSAQRYSWLVQLYYDDPALHYEVWHLGRQRDRLEIGLHFESRNHSLNERLLAGFSRYMFEVKHALGEQFEAEPWDKGWTKVYETWPLLPFTLEYHMRVARRLAEVIEGLHPIYQVMRR